MGDPNVGSSACWWYLKAEGWARSECTWDVLEEEIWGLSPEQSGVASLSLGEQEAPQGALRTAEVAGTQGCLPSRVTVLPLTILSSPLSSRPIQVKK